MKYNKALSLSIQMSNILANAKLVAKEAEEKKKARTN